MFDYIIEWCNSNSGFLSSLLTIFLICFSCLQWYTSELQRKFDIHRVKKEHYKSIQKVIGEFITIIPYTETNNQFAIISNEINTNDEFKQKINELYITTNLLTTEARHLFKQEVLNFENELYEIFSTIRLYLIKKYDKNTWIDGITNNIKAISEKIRNKEDIYEDDLNIFEETKFFKLNTLKNFICLIFLIGIFLFVLNFIVMVYSHNETKNIKTNQTITIINNTNSPEKKFENYSHASQTIIERKMTHHKNK
ncbi:hypothetical protein IJ541_07395 [bacterium]|nr:hypothetical protein [bacterium]